MIMRCFRTLILVFLLMGLCSINLAQESDKKITLDDLTDEQWQIININNQMQMYFWILENTHNFNYIENEINNEIEFSEVPEELMPFFEKFLDLCRQGKEAQNQNEELKKLLDERKEEHNIEYYIENLMSLKLITLIDV